MHTRASTLALLLLLIALPACGGDSGGDAGAGDTHAGTDATTQDTAAPDATPNDPVDPDAAPEAAALSDDASLSALVPQRGELSPAFAPEVTAYTVTLPYGTLETPTLSATASHAAATITQVDAADVSAADDASRTSTVTVTAQDGVTTRTYSVRFDVAAYRTLHDFSVADIYGDLFDMASLKGKKVLVVNVASQCGFTPQYEPLQTLYATYGGDAFEVIAFPANNFGNQEPGTDEEICTFAHEKYGATFPLMSKISVKGADIHPVYAWLTQKSQNGVLDAPVQWNFQKFMVDEQGQVVDVAMSAVDPLDPKIVDWVTAP